MKIRQRVRECDLLRALACVPGHVGFDDDHGLGSGDIRSSDFCTVEPLGGLMTRYENPIPTGFVSFCFRKLQCKTLQPLPPLLEMILDKKGNEKFRNALEWLARQAPPQFCLQPLAPFTTVLPPTTTTKRPFLAMTNKVFSVGYRAEG